MTDSGRMACAFCRKRKLRCNREVPKCDSCLKFGYDCEYAPPKESSKKDPKSGPTPSHVKKFEDRLGRYIKLSYNFVYPDPYIQAIKLKITKLTCI